MVNSFTLLLTYLLILSKVNSYRLPREYTKYMTPEPSPIRCKCSPLYCNDDSEECASDSGMCFMKVQEEDTGNFHVVGKGCVALGTESFFLFNSDCKQPNNMQHRCCMTDFCNDRDSFTDTHITSADVPPTIWPKIPVPPQNTWPESVGSTLTYPIYTVGALVFVIAMSLGGMLLFKSCKMERVNNSLNRSCDLPQFVKTPRTMSTNSKTAWQSVPSQDVTGSCSSGSGVPRLLEKTLIREITFSEQIGKGRYGEVWRGKWRAEGQVAVKVFSNREECSWWHEAEMYQNYWLRHDNVLSFVGADQKDCVANMEYYLVLEYLPKGSLFDFLHDALLTIQESIRLSLSLSAGLDYLHSEIKSSVAKPSIAHRDLKSKNVLVKNTGQGYQCCIADFGLAARSDFFDKLPDKSTFNFQVGTRRYMAPELLNSSINQGSFEGLRRADMYMFGLISWEIGHRIAPQTRPYQYPFQNEVPGDPTVQDMATVVVDQQIRPQLPEWWSSEPSLIELSRITRECWDHDPSIRLTSLRVRKTLSRLVTCLQRKRDSGCYFTDTSDQGFQSSE